MPGYSFEELSPIDFEILTRDLLQEELNIRLENFTAGRDKGIDLRYCPSNDKAVIIQCKHYPGESFNQLLSKLKDSELEKIEKLNPSKYILVTSCKLTPERKEKLISLFSPYIRTASDIYGKDDLNGLLAKHHKIEQCTFKLWLPSLSVLEEVLHSKIKNISRDALEKMYDHIQYYVQNESYAEAIRILEDHHFCVIAGIPGIGKTMLAEMLSLHYVKQGYELIRITSDISEAYEFNYTNNSRLYYYDDFLGQTTLSDKLSKNEDQRLLDFIQRMHESNTSKLILTTREYILNQSQLLYEKLSRKNFNAQTCVVDLKKYNRLNRAQILYNHIYFSDLIDVFKKELLKDRNYIKIIDHRNYNPRIVDLMTQHHHVQHMKPDDYFKNFITNLDNPAEIWKHAFEQQLSERSQHLLIVMASLPEYVFLEDLKEAFYSFHQHQSEKYKFKTSSKDFLNALKELEGNFITTERTTNLEGQVTVSFHNGSVRDFLRDYISSDEQILLSLFGTVKYFDQYAILWEFGEKEKGSMRYRETLIRNDGANFINTTFYNVDMKSCRLMRIKPNEKKASAFKIEIAFEEKARLIFSILTQLNTNLSATAKLFEQVLERINDRILTKKADKGLLVRFVEDVKQCNNSVYKLNSSLLDSIKNYLSTDFNSLEDVELFWKFKEGFPETVQDVDADGVKEQFINLAYNGSPNNDPDSYREEASKIEELAELLEVDLSDRIEELEDAASQIENYIYDNYDYNEGYGLSGKGIFNMESTDSEIDSIFNTLN